MMSILLVLFLAFSLLSGLSSLLQRFCSSCWFALEVLLKRVGRLFHFPGSGVSQNQHENQVVFLSVDLIHHSQHLGVIDFLHPIQGCEANQRITKNHPLRLICVFVIEIAVLIASASALKIAKGIGSRISLFSPGVTRSCKFGCNPGSLRLGFLPTRLLC
jgi:hypothetical protein